MGIFSTTHIHKGETIAYEKSITVHEHKAPTDESVKLLNEMQQKAESNILKTIKIDENYLKAVVIIFKDNLVENRINYGAKFILNGEEHIVEDYIDIFEWINVIEKAKDGFGNTVILNAIHKKYSEAIAKQIMLSSMKSFIR